MRPCRGQPAPGSSGRERRNPWAIPPAQPQPRYCPFPVRARGGRNAAASSCSTETPMVAGGSLADQWSEKMVRGRSGQPVRVLPHHADDESFDGERLLAQVDTQGFEVFVLG